MELVTPLRLMLGMTLAYAGLQKARNLPAFVAGVLQYRILPAPFARWYGYLLPVAEVGTGTLLLIGVWIQAAAIVSAAMFASFSIAVGLNLIRKRQMPCFCFGADSSNIGWHTLTRILLLLLSSSFLAITHIEQDALWSLFVDPTIAKLINLIPTILLTAFGLLVVSLLEVTPLVIQAWTARAAPPTYRGYSVVWTREPTQEANLKQ